MVGAFVDLLNSFRQLHVVGERVRDVPLRAPLVPLTSIVWMRLVRLSRDLILLAYWPIHRPRC